jgi:hypothetical protein
VDGRVGVLRSVMGGFRETRNGEWCEFGIRGC